MTFFVASAFKVVWPVVARLYDRSEWLDAAAQNRLAAVIFGDQ